MMGGRHSPNSATIFAALAAHAAAHPTPFVHRLRANRDANRGTPYSLLEVIIAALLTAQTTDEVSERAFKNLRRLAEGTPNGSAINGSTPNGSTINSSTIARLPAHAIEDAIRAVNYYRTKARNIRLIAARMEGLPDDQARRPEFLLSLPGVGVKTANLVLGVYFDLPYIAVDTHVLRICYRLGIVASPRDAAAAEKALAQLFPQEQWVTLNDYGVRFGKYICVARRPHCSRCMLRAHCPQIGVTESD